MEFYEAILDVELLDEEFEFIDSPDEAYDNLELDPVVEIVGPAYSGSITVIPARESQILQTSGYLMYDDITVEAIPSNYGLITWDGTKLTVS